MGFYDNNYVAIKYKVLEDYSPKTHLETLYNGFKLDQQAFRTIAATPLGLL